MGNNSSKESNFNRIPNEVWLYILYYMSDADLCKLARVSKRMKDLAEDNILWMRITNKCLQCISFNYLSPININSERPFKIVHIMHKATEKRLYEPAKKKKKI